MKEPASRPSHLAILCERQQGLCYYCHVRMVAIGTRDPRWKTVSRPHPDAATVDHKWPLSRGGANDIANKVAACNACNNLKGNLTEDEFRRLRDRDRRELRRWQERLGEARRREMRG